MVAHDILKAQKAKTTKTTPKTLAKSKRKKSRKSRRSIRRRRSKARYYKTLQALRSDRKTKDLCSSVHLVQIRDMETDWPERPVAVPIALPAEIVEWQKQDQLAYWKAKAIGLEFENRMLKQHLRNVYAKTIECYSQQPPQEEHYDEEEFQNEAEKLPDETPSVVRMEVNSKKSCEADQVPVTVPKFPDLKDRAMEMEKIYGDKAPKILGMETAIQLNYERHCEKANPAFWPNLPLRL